MMNISQVDDTIDCRALATRYFGQPAQKAGLAWQWYCPFHADHKTPSFTAYPNGYHCFGCGTHGSSIGLVMAMELVDYPTAMRYLAGVATAAPARQPCPVHLDKHQATVESWLTAGWQASTWRVVDEAAACLASPPGRARPRLPAGSRPYTRLLAGLAPGLPAPAAAPAPGGGQ